MGDFEVVVVNYRSSARLSTLLEAIGPDVTVTVVDNSAACDPVAAIARRRRRTRYVDAGGNVGFAVAANLGAARCQAPVVVFVNPDCTVDRRVLAALAGILAEDPAVVTAAPALADDDGRIVTGGGGWQPTLARVLVHALGLHSWAPRRGLWARPRRGERLEVEWLAGTCMAARRDDFLAVGGFDERYFLYSEDMAVGARLAARGARQLLCGDLVVGHSGGRSSTVRPGWLWAQRGAALADYLAATRPAPLAWLLRVVLAGGFTLRAAAYRMGGRRHRVPEMLAYARATLRPSATPSPATRARPSPIA